MQQRVNFIDKMANASKRDNKKGTPPNQENSNENVRSHFITLMSFLIVIRAQAI
jgi:hypothetical protein